MLTLMKGLPADVLGIEATGKVTHEDYRDTLIPKAEAMIARGPVKMIYVVGKECTGFQLEALWDDGAFGVKHWHQFDRVAVVTDHLWLRSAVSMFAPLIPAEVRLFRLSEMSAAKGWVIGAQQTAT